jgi:hypothetical protein
VKLKVSNIWKLQGVRDFDRTSVVILHAETALASKNCSKVRMLMDWCWREERGSKPESVVGPGLLLALPGDQNDVISKL